MSPSEPLRYFGLNCTLKASPADSSTQVLLSEITRRLEDRGARGGSERVVDHDVRFGVSSDEGDGDGWPALRPGLGR